ncbi:MAG TPA: dienelactone hydrolase [Burkholderiaceae bacterium]|nr:dienelactone hydrolase [Burkholderiaceae bacterium]
MRLVVHWAVCLWLSTFGQPGHAQTPGLGFTQLPQPGGGLVTVFYPSSDPETSAVRGPFRLSWADDGRVSTGNGRVVVISHGSGGSPWVHVDLARALVQRGFTVALPQHAGDNHLDPSEPGPESWIRRPIEVSRAIDVVAGSPALAADLRLDAVGVFGGSAGGHTALSMAGGTWSKSRFRSHCERHIREDFSSCVGFFTLLDGDWLDGPKIWLARSVIAARFSDDTVHRGHDPRVRSVVAMVPFAADFDPASLKQPATALGLVIADRDVNQVPRFHAEAILAACEPRCEVVMRLPDGGHGAMLSPMPPLEAGSVAHRLLSDPPGFDRARRVPELNARIADFFVRTLASGR